jgi:hypothetical protein
MVHLRTCDTAARAAAWLGCRIEREHSEASPEVSAGTCARGRALFE